MDRLVLTYEHDRSYFDDQLLKDDFGWLEMTVKTGKFEGTAGFWVQWQDVSEFGDKIRAQPMKLGKPLEVEWGSWEHEKYTKHIGISIKPTGALGELLVQAQMQDFHDEFTVLKAQFSTVRGALDLFGRDIERLISGDGNKAELFSR